MSEDRDSGLVQTFLSLGPDGVSCFRMFARGGSTPGCYVLGLWAAIAAKEYIRSTAVLKNWSTTPSRPLDVVVVNDALCKEMVRDCLLRRGVSVEYYERPAGGGPYTCVQRGSPGNIADFETTLFAFEEAEVQLMASGCVILGGGGGANVAHVDRVGYAGGVSGGVAVGFAALNTTLRQLIFAEYLDTPQLTSLDALVAQVNLKELTLLRSSSSSGALASDEQQERAVKQLCSRAGTTLRVTTLKDLRKQQQHGVAAPYNLDALKDILRVPETRLQLTQTPLAARAMEAVLDRLDVLDANNQRAFYLQHIVPSTYMKLDTAAIEALHLLSKKPEPRGALPVSVYTWLNRCFTGMGSRAMRQWLLQPLRNVGDIQQRQTMVELFVEQPAMRDRLIAEVLRRCSDMDRLNRKLQRRCLALRETQAFLTFVNVIPVTLDILRSYRGQHVKLLTDEYVAPLEDIYEHMANLKTLIEATVDFSDRTTARVNAAFDDQLQELHGHLTRVQRDMESEYGRVLRHYGWNEKQLKYEYHSTYGYVFRVSRKEDRQLRASKDLRIVSTAKDGVRFVSDKLAALSEQYRRISDTYDIRQQDLKSKLVDTIASYLPILDDTKEMVAALDVFVAWSLVVKDAPRGMVRPTVSDCGDGEVGQGTLIELKNVRHPLVELRQPDFVANSLQLTGARNGLLITGPNMGGKSTFMRSVGIAVVLAQAGCFVPADAATLRVRDAVMCRVGAMDHLAQGVSTFMVEMLESAAILSGATRQSLVIIDELGRGTSTYDGFGLAWAIAREVAQSIHAAMLFSTHFHELTQLPEQCGNVQNAHFGAAVNEIEGTLRFLYKLEPGPCGRSYGLYVASLAHMPDELIAKAREKAAELESFEHDGKIDTAAEAQTEAGQRVAAYAKRIRALEALTDECAKEVAQKQLRDEIAHDSAVMPLLAASL